MTNAAATLTAARTEFATLRGQSVIILRSDYGRTVTPAEINASIATFYNAPRAGFTTESTEQKIAEAWLDAAESQLEWLLNGAIGDVV